MLFVKESLIHGLGLFTDQPIKAGEHIADWIGVPMTLEEYIQKYGESRIFSLEYEGVIYASKPPNRCLLTYTNDGNNAEMRGLSCFATQDIPKGGEILRRYPPGDYPWRKEA